MVHWIPFFFLFMAILCPAPATAAETLYAASVRSPLGDRSHLVAGNLYTVNLSTGVFTLVGAIRVGGVTPVGVTGLADHPETDTLYGITADSSPNYPRSLVTIDVATAEATVVGSMEASGSDISFNRAGTLFIWLRETSQLGRVDLSSGRVTALGSPGPSSETGGIAIDANGRAYLAATGATGSLDVIDTTTGTIVKGPMLRGAPYPAGINSLTISPAGVLFAVNTNLGSPANTLLVKIDTKSGVVTQVGPLPNDTDALIFDQPPWSIASVLSSKEGLTLLAAVLALGLALTFFILSRRRPGDRPR